MSTTDPRSSRNQSRAGRSARAAVAALALLGLLLFAPAAPAATTGSQPEESAQPGVEDYNRGVAMLKQGEWAAARKAFEKALDAREDFAEAHNNLAYSLRKLGEEHWAAAMEHYDRALELEPKLAEAYMYRGVLHVLQGNEEAAQQDHAELRELNPKLADQLEWVIENGEEKEGTTWGIADSW